MAHGFLSYSTDQAFLLPPDPRDWLSADHLAYQVIDIVGELDTSRYFASYGKDGRGAAPYSPLMMVGLLLYAWTRKLYSSRKIAALCRDDLGGRVVCGGCFPDHRTVNSFRMRHQGALNALFKQSVDLCREAGMVGLVEAALDGTKIEASASRRKAMSYSRMVDEEARVQAEIDGYFKRAAEEDAAEDALFGPDGSGLPASGEIERRQNRLAKIRAAKAAIEAEAKAAADTRRRERAETEAAYEAKGRKPCGPPPKIDETPKPTAQRSFTDPECRIMKAANGSYIQAYNAQAVVDGKFQVIVACSLSWQAADVPHLPEMLDQTITNVGVPNRILADPGYFSEENYAVAEARGVQALIPPDRQRHGTPNSPCSPATPEEEADMDFTERMRRRISTAEGRTAYAKRKGIVEPVFGQTKGCAGHPGYLGFLRRGFEKCSAEWLWVCASHNILKYIRYKTAKAGGTLVVAPKRANRNECSANRIQFALEGV
ncbi:MAG TPA: IS1182 family transposase [Candidatus Deferrimicrobiaceae bacterium]